MVGTDVNCSANFIDYLSHNFAAGTAPTTVPAALPPNVTELNPTIPFTVEDCYG